MYSQISPEIHAVSHSCQLTLPVKAARSPQHNPPVLQHTTVARAEEPVCHHGFQTNSHNLMYTLKYPLRHWDHVIITKNSHKYLSYLGEVCTKSPLTIALSSRSMPFFNEQHITRETQINVNENYDRTYVHINIWTVLLKAAFSVGSPVTFEPHVFKVHLPKIDFLETHFYNSSSM